MQLDLNPWSKGGRWDWDLYGGVRMEAQKCRRPQHLQGWGAGLWLEPGNFPSAELPLISVWLKSSLKTRLLETILSCLSPLCQSLLLGLNQKLV